MDAGLHDMIVDELCNKKSISALIWLISQGRELEASYQKRTFFISAHNSTRRVSIWIDKQEQAFCSMEELLESADIDGNTIIDIWDDIQIDTLF